MITPLVKQATFPAANVLLGFTHGYLLTNLRKLKNNMKSLLCFFVLLANVGLCQASPINFASLLGDTVLLTVEPYTSGESNGSLYVGLTQGVINGQTFYMFCNDFQNQISPPTTYDVTVVSLAAGAFTSDTLGLSLAQLQQQATLGLNFGSAPSGNTAADTDTQQVIWNYTGGNYTPDSGMLADTAAMQATYQTANYSGSYLLDVTSEPGQQAFMPINTAATPEPVSLVLIGSGLMYLGLCGRRRLSRVTLVEQVAVSPRT
jgi:hypothetical protein